MKYTFALLALVCAAPAFGAASKTTCSDSSGEVVYTRYDYVYGIPPSPELDLPDWTVVWTLKGQEYSRTETKMNGQSTTTGKPVWFRFVDGTYVELEKRGDPRRESVRIWAQQLSFYASDTMPGPLTTYVICSRYDGPPVP